MKQNRGLELYWEDVGERVIYAQFDDYAWKLPEVFFKYKKERSLYIYHDNKLAAFYSKSDTRREAIIGSRFFQSEKNVQTVVARKKAMWRKTQNALAILKKRNSKRASTEQLRTALVATVNVYYEALSTHYLTQPQFFEAFERGEAVLSPRTTKIISEARFKYTRRAWTAAMEVCRQLFQEYARRNYLTLAQAESLRYEELQAGKFNTHILQQRAEKFVMTSSGHVVRVYAGSIVDEYINAYEQYKDVTEVKGIIGNKGVVRGGAFVVTNENLDLKKLSKGMKQGMVLIVQNAWPEFLPYYKLAAAMVTNEGGITSHGVVVSRELGIPCVVGTKIATKIFQTGDIVSVDAIKGVVKK